MKHKTMFVLLLILGLVLVLGAWLVGLPRVVGAQESESRGNTGIQQIPLGTAFTYQGRLLVNGSPANGSYDCIFELYDAGFGGNSFGSLNLIVSATNGLFVEVLDFGSNVFTGDARFLEIRVRPMGSPDAYTTLVPRQQLRPTPYALALPGLWTQPNDTSPNVIGGFSGNEVINGVVGATISGGGIEAAPDEFGNNTVTDDYGTIGGGRSNLAGDQVGTPSDASFATVGGGRMNVASGRAATVGGGDFNWNYGDSATIGGGFGNQTHSNDYAAIGGGANNQTGGEAATVGGGAFNEAMANYATIAGGGLTDPTDPHTGNHVTDNYGTVGGGGNNQAGNANANLIDATYNTVGGGYGNIADGGSTILGGGFATVSGGYGNIVSAGGGTISGGRDNIVTADATQATIGGGFENTASHHHVTVSGGYSNTASTAYAAVGGGRENTASGAWATVPGGFDNVAAGDYSFAAGRRARAEHDGSFVWADSTDEDFVSTTEDQFLVRANGGAVFIGDVVHGSMLEVTNLSSMYSYGVYASGGSSGVYGFSATGTGIGGDGQTGVSGRSVYTDGVGVSAQSLMGNPIEAYGGVPGDREFYVSNDGDVYADGTFNSPASDLAEMLPAVEGLEPGDVLVIGSGGQLTRSTQAYQPTVVGVYSSQPGFLGGAGEDADLADKIPLAILGVVPVKVSAENGSIQPGDLLVASVTPGHAMKAGPNPPVGTVLGKALEGLNGGTGIIQMLVMLQ